MAFIPVPDVAEVVLTYTHQATNVQMKNVQYVREFSLLPWTSVTLAGVADVYEAWEGATADLQRGVDVTLTNITVRDISAPNGLIVERGVNLPGAVNSPMLPSSVTWALKCVTGFSGRSFRGRTYWIGLTEGQVADDEVVLTNANAILAAMNTLLTSLQQNDTVPVVVSRFTNGAPRVEGVATDIVEWQFVNRVVDTQRRRLSGAGT